MPYFFWWNAKLDKYGNVVSIPGIRLKDSGFCGGNNHLVRGQSTWWWMIHFQDNFYLTWNRNLLLILLFTWICRLDLSLGFVTWICLNLNWLLAVTGVMHEADDAYSIRSTWSCYWLDQFLTLALNILILSIFYISMDLSTNYFAHFSGCWASFACSCHYPRMLCHVFWSQVEYKIVYFIIILDLLFFKFSC